MRVAVFGSSLVSTHRNGAAIYFRGLLKALVGQGFGVTFFEPDAFERQAHRDISDPSWARVRVYAPTEEGARAALRQAEEADIVIKASGVGVLDELLEREVLTLRARHRLVAFWDVDPPATLDQVIVRKDDPLRALLPHYDAILARGGGPAVASAYKTLGATTCIAVYNALDAETHHPTSRDLRYACALAFLGNRRRDREAAVEELFFSVARRRPQWRFLLGGDGWEAVRVPGNVVKLGHIYTAEHNTLNTSALAVLNVHQQSMARYGHAPTTRLFEAAGAGACVISDDGLGLDTFLLPGREILVARDGLDVTAYLDQLSVPRSAEIGQAARHRLLSEHTTHHRAAALATALSALSAGRGEVISVETLGASPARR